MRLLLCLALLLVLHPAVVVADEPPTFLLKWGSSGTGDGQFNTPLGIGVDQSGNVYVVDTYNNRVQKFSGTGTFLGKFGAEGSGLGRFHLPIDVAIAPNGDIYVSDQGNTRIEVFASSFEYVRQWHAAGAAPLSIAMDPSGQFLYTTIFDGHLVQYLVDGTYQRTWGYAGITLSTPVGFDVGSSGSIYTTPVAEDKVRRFSPEGQLLDVWGQEGHGPGQMDSPLAVAVDGGENVYVADEDRRIQKFTSKGVFLAGWGSVGSKDGQFIGGVNDMAIDSNGNIFALEPQRALIHKFGQVNTPTRPRTWGRLKALYR